MSPSQPSTVTGGDPWQPRDAAEGPQGRTGVSAQAAGTSASRAVPTVPPHWGEWGQEGTRNGPKAVRAGGSRQGTLTTCSLGVLRGDGTLRQAESREMSPWCDWDRDERGSPRDTCGLWCRSGWRREPQEQGVMEEEREAAGKGWRQHTGMLPRAGPEPGGDNRATQEEGYRVGVLQGTGRDPRGRAQSCQGTRRGGGLERGVPGSSNTENRERARRKAKGWAGVTKGCSGWGATKTRAGGIRGTL